MRFFLSRLRFCGVVLVATTLGGCNADSNQKGKPVEQYHDGDGHDHSAEEHSHTGPHGGHLVELGANEEYHAEMLHDDQTNKVTIYILDGSGKKNVPIQDPAIVINMMSDGAFQQYKLAAVPQTNEPRDASSCFQVEDAKLCKALDADDCKGRLAVNISGKQFVGEIEHHDHDEHEHKEDAKAK